MENKVDYEEKYELACKFLVGRLLVLRPIRRNIKEITVLRGVAHAMGDNEIESKFQELYSKYHRIES